MNKLILSIVVIGIAFAKANSQSTIQEVKRKSYTATRVTTSPVIDGDPFESFWDAIPAGGDFVMLEPRNGEPEKSTHRTEIKIAYDDQALYVAGYMYDNDPDRILRQFSQRDQVDAQADLFGLYINTYNNQINQTRFFATSGNSLGDAIVEGNSEDFSFNVVFLSEATIDDKGWYVEMKIPYRTLRFPENEVQDWSFQVFRRIRHLNAEYTYNFVDITTGNFTQYDALLEGVENIDPPLRLNLYPFVSYINDSFDGETNQTFNAGMDLKYGINDAFTLDVTLIPDFGQAAFDNVELNLGPFEQLFNENRAFFIEGTDLFEKGNLFFSRRIGQTPTGAGSIATLDNEDIIDNPSVAPLINAVKVTGRTDEGLGIGFLNAITEKTEATVLNNDDNLTRRVVTEPLTNYNMLVLDQQYGNNSSIAFSNANTLRNGSFTDANVSALTLDHNNAEATDNYRAGVNMSNRFTPDSTSTGFSAEADWRKTSGKWRPRLGVFMVDRMYDPNDLGRQFRNNFLTVAADIAYLQQTQQGMFNRYEVAMRVRHRRAWNPGFHTETELNINPFFITKERFAFGADFNVNTERKEQFESRITDLIVRYNPAYFIGGFISSDYRKKFALDMRVGWFQRFNDPEKSYNFRIAPRYRFSDKLFFVYSMRWNKNENRMSYVTLINNDATSILSERDTHSVENNLTATYNFNNRQVLALSFRNFWSKAAFSRNYQELQIDGRTIDSDYISDADSNPDANFNVWNLDLSYQWRFAPGSFATLLYRNSINNFNNDGGVPFQDSLDDLFLQPARHNISLRLSYFLDVNSTKSWWRSS
jgi:hypothetical protein